MEPRNEKVGVMPRDSIFGSFWKRGKRLPQRIPESVLWGEEILDHATHGALRSVTATHQRKNILGQVLYAICSPFFLFFFFFFFFWQLGFLFVV